MQLKGASSLYNFERLDTPGESSGGQLTPAPGNDPGPCRGRRRLPPHSLNVDRQQPYASPRKLTSLVRRGWSTVLVIDNGPCELGRTFVSTSISEPSEGDEVNTMSLFSACSRQLAFHSFAMY